ncbi:hypothetical protein Q8A73_017900 [Channa argus]|nr:hypothetical protein Q8A73_017900 [Channa argus]
MRRVFGSFRCVAAFLRTEPRNKRNVRVQSVHSSGREEEAERPGKGEGGPVLRGGCDRPLARSSSLHLRHSRGSECAAGCSGCEVPLRSRAARTNRKPLSNTRDRGQFRSQGYRSPFGGE